MQDRFAIAQENRDGIVKLLRDKDVLGLGASGKNPDLFALALALGYNAGKRTPLKSKLGWVQDSAFGLVDPELSIIRSVVFSELQKEGKEDEVDDIEVVHTIAEEYANTGFELLKEMIPDAESYDEENFCLALQIQLDELFETLQ